MTDANAIQIDLLPLGHTLTVTRGESIQDALFAQGVEFPCGGRGRCRGCRVRVLSGDLPPTEEDRQRFSATELLEGWRLACRARPTSALTLELAQWEAAILTDRSACAFTPRPGLGVAVDLGTTTVVAQLVDLNDGHVLAVRLGLNAQARHGADIMSRVDFATAGGGGAELTRLVREQMGGLVAELVAEVPERAAEVGEVVIVGNTVMHHLFCGFSVEPLAHTPFEPTQHGLHRMRAGELGWSAVATATVRFLPCLGGFVGSDILAGLLATRLHESADLAALIDLGTNGEIVVGDRTGLLCASTAAGPAFEGARIAAGMRAATGAIAEVAVADGRLQCRVLGHVAPRGLCGSGLVDAAACSLDLGWLRPNGRFAQGSSLELAAPVTLTANDIRELQLAKGAIAAGLRLLVEQRGAGLDALTRIHLAGAFGNYINRGSARRIGLLPFGPERVEAAGNTALLGAKLALFNLPRDAGEYAELCRMTRHVSLHEDPRFHEVFVEELPFPEPPP